MSHILDILNAPWALEPGKLHELVNIYATHVRGEKIDIAGIEAQLGKPLVREEQGYEIREGVAIVPIDGVIAQKMNIFSRVSGGASTQLIGRDVRGALADPRVHSIILHIDSPGGSVAGTQELAQLVFGARQQKPIVTLADQIMSGALWIGTAAEEVYISADTVFVGSLGVIMKHVDISKAEEKAGITTTEIYSGKYKRIASEHGPLSEQGRETLQGLTDHVYAVFVDEVAKHRGTDAETVLRDMADGRVFLGRKAIDAGLVDGVSTLDALIADLNAGRKPASKARTTAGVAVTGQAQNGDVVAGSAAAPEAVHTYANQGVHMDKEFIIANHPAIAEAFRAEGYERGAREGREQGATTERERIQAVEGAGLPGHEPLIAGLKFDGKTTGPQAAEQVVAAERQKAAGRLAAIKDDGTKIVVPAAPSDTGEHAAANAGQSVEERCKAKWNADANIRSEFASLESYTAFEKNAEAGHVRISGARRRAG